MFQLLKEVVIAEIADFRGKIIHELNEIFVRARTVELKPLCLKCTKIVDA